MASTKKANVIVPQEKKDLLEQQINRLKNELNEKLNHYKSIHNKEHYIRIIDDSYDYIIPNHYKNDDGRETWEHMIDKYGVEKTQIFCELTAFKYEQRLGKKPGEDELRDQKKMKWYKDKAKELSLLLK